MATTINTQAVTATSRRTGAVGPIWKVAGIASLAGVAVAGIYEAVVRAAGVSLDMGSSKAEAEAVPAGGFLTFTLMFAVAGFLVALGIARWAKRPARTYAVTAWAVVAVSLVLPFLPGYMATETRVVLALAHVVVGAVIIPVITKRLGRTHR